MPRPIFLCGGDFTPGPRDTDCPNALHDHPLPAGYGEAHEVAMSRLYRGWSNLRCPDCGLYGWGPSLRGGS
jgi:hypothetical protein